MVWCSWFGYESADGGVRGTSGQRDGQKQITEDRDGMPKNWNLKLGVKGSHCRVFSWAGAPPDLHFGYFTQAARWRAGTQRQQVTSRDREGLKRNLRLKR